MAQYGMELIAMLSNAYLPCIAHDSIKLMQRFCVANGRICHDMRTSFLNMEPLEMKKMIAGECRPFQSDEVKASVEQRPADKAESCFRGDAKRTIRDMREWGS